MKKRRIMYAALPIAIVFLMTLAAVLSISLSNAKSIHFAIDFARLWLNVCLLLLAAIAVLVLLKLLKKYDLTKAIAMTAVLALLSATESAAVYFNDRHHDCWFYDLEERLTAKYAAIERLELSLDRRGPTLFIYCGPIDLPSDSDAIVSDIKDDLRIGSDNLFQSSYTGRDGVSSDTELDLDFTVII